MIVETRPVYCVVQLHDFISLERITMFAIGTVIDRIKIVNVCCVYMFHCILHRLKINRLDKRTCVIVIKYL